jgi:hypothetical protein
MALLGAIVALASCALSENDTGLWGVEYGDGPARVIERAPAGFTLIHRDEGMLMFEGADGPGEPRRRVTFSFSRGELAMFSDAVMR